MSLAEKKAELARLREQQQRIRSRSSSTGLKLDPLKAGRQPPEPSPKRRGDAIDGYGLEEKKRNRASPEPLPASYEGYDRERKRDKRPRDRDRARDRDLGLPSLPSRFPMASKAANDLQQIWTSEILDLRNPGIEI